MPEKGQSLLSPLLQELTDLANTPGGVEAEIARTGLFGHKLKINISRRSTRLEKMWRQSILALTSVSIGLLGLTGWATANGFIKWDAVGDALAGSNRSSRYIEPAVSGGYVQQPVPTQAPAGPSPTSTPVCLPQGQVVNELEELQPGEPVTFAFTDGTQASGTYGEDVHTEFGVRHIFPKLDIQGGEYFVNAPQICDIEQR